MIKALNARKLANDATGNRKARIESLCQQARRLSIANSDLYRGSARAPFCVAVMSDDAKLSDPETVIKFLPRGAAFIFRDYAHKDRYARAKPLRQLADRYGVLFLVAGDVSLARRLKADGLHLPGWLLKKPGLWRDYRGIRSAACHSAYDVRYAWQNGVDAAILSPVWATTSHRDAPHLGRAAFISLAAQANLPILALGGITRDNVGCLRGKNISGIAAISAFA